MPLLFIKVVARSLFQLILKASHFQLFLCSLSLWKQVCNIRSVGEGPVIYVHPTQVDFGSIYVLKDASRVLNLSNQAFIPASFQARMVSRLWDCCGMKIQLCLSLVGSGPIFVTCLRNDHQKQRFTWFNCIKLSFSAPVLFVDQETPHMHVVW